MGNERSSQVDAACAALLEAGREAMRQSDSADMFARGAVASRVVDSYLAFVRG